jgi:hypothetical protein
VEDARTVSLAGDGHPGEPGSGGGHTQTFDPRHWRRHRLSAFEILSHRRCGKANLITVLDLLANAEWDDAGLKATRFKVKYQGKTSKANLIQKLYYGLYRARNDFLHGNPVRSTKLFPMNRSGGPTSLHAAPLIYRAALMGFLPFKRPPAKKGRRPA